MNSFLEWLKSDYIELLGALAGFVYLMLSIRQHIYLWPFGIITSVLYVIVFYTQKFYADMGLQVYYVVISIYGWYHWKFGKKKDSAKLPVGRLKTKHWMYHFFIITIIFFVILWILVNYTDSDVPIGDAFTTALSITATWMLAQKKLEHWILWIVVDLVSMGLYIYKGMYPTVALFFLYTSLAIVGFREWRKDYYSQFD